MWKAKIREEKEGMDATKETVDRKRRNRRE